MSLSTRISIAIRDRLVGAVSAIAETFRVEKEADTDDILMEDGSGFILAEDAA